MAGSNSATLLNRTNRSLNRPSTTKTLRPASSNSKSMQLDFKKFASQLEGQSKSGIKPRKQIKTDFFHSVLYKMKMQKDILEDKIK